MYPSHNDTPVRNGVGHSLYFVMAGLDSNVKLSAVHTPVQRTDIVAKIVFVFLQHASCYSDTAAGKFILILLPALMWTIIVEFTLLYVTDRSASQCSHTEVHQWNNTLTVIFILDVHGLLTGSPVEHKNVEHFVTFP